MNAEYTEHQEHHEHKREPLGVGTVITWVGLAIMFVGMGATWGQLKGELQLVKREQQDSTESIDKLSQKIEETIVKSIEDNRQRIRETEQNCTRLWQSLHRQ